MVCSLWVLCFCCLVEASELTFTFNGDIIPLNNQTIVHLTKAITLTASLEEEDVTGQPVDEHANVSQGVEYRWIINHVTVYYTETDTMTFSNGIPQLYLNRPMGDIGLSYQPYHLATSNEFPANEIIEVDKTVSIQETFWSDISNNNLVTWVVYGGSVASLITSLAPRYSLAAGAISLLTSLVSDIIDAVTIDKVRYFALFSPPLQDHPGPGDTWSFSIIVQGEAWVMNLKIYDGKGEGFAPNGETTYFQQIFYNNLSERHEYHVYRNRSF